MTIIPHPESFEVRDADGKSTYFYFDDDATRRAFSGRMTRKQAEQAAKTFAGSSGK